jgi:hypothetical protein
VSLELWSAIFSGATFTVIAVTAIAAVVQLRHLRASNQLDALLTLMELWNQPVLQEHFAYVRGELQSKVKDRNFLRELEADLEKGPLSRSEHVEFVVADYWEQIGAFLKYQLIDERSWLDVASPQVARSWELMEPELLMIRQRFGPAAYENFEYAAVRARLWLDKYPKGNYPRATPRMAQLVPSRARDEGAQ